jgi:radical SAM superfamily enzyme YgiQ (UPF0313 family)
VKIGLVAMSGVRAVNPELNKLGLTLPGFVERNKTIASLPSLGLLTLAGLTPSDVTVEYIEFPDDVGANHPGRDFDLVAISSFSARIKDAYRLADLYRIAGTRVVLGGLHVSALPKEALQHADAIVIGEGEPAWPQLLADFGKGRLQRVYDTRAAGFSLADAPMPRFELLNPERYNRLTVQTQRGCPYRCDFCAASVMISESYKIKPVEKVISEIRRIKEIWPSPFIEFADDNSFVNKPHSKRLLRALRKEDVRWFTEADISIADDDELLNLMRDSGCAQVLIGLESPTLVGLDGIEKKGNWKARRSDTYMRSIERIQSHGITVNGCFVLGLDGTGPESFSQVWHFVRDSGLYEVQVTVMTPFPGTPLYKRLTDEGRILQGGAWELCTLFDVNFVPDMMSRAELESGFQGLVEKLYSAEFTRERRSHFRQQLYASRTRQQLRDTITT